MKNYMENLNIKNIKKYKKFKIFFPLPIYNKENKRENKII